MKRILLILFFFSFVISVTKAQEIPSNIPTDGLVAYYPFNGNANDESGNGNNGTVNGNVILSENRNGNLISAYDWPNSNSGFSSSAYISLPNLSSAFTNGLFSISLWVMKYPNPTNADPRILGIGESGLIFDRSTSSIKVYLGLGLDVKSNPVGENQWAHIVYTNNGESGQSFFYLNGNLIHQRTTTPKLAIVSNTSKPWELGRKSTSAFNGFGGKLDDIGIWNRVLSEQEIQNLYNSSSTNGGDILLNGTVSAENNQIKNVADPTDAQDAVTLSLLLSKIEGLQDQIDALQTQSNSGTLTDQDGNSYPYLTIKDQTWTVKNAEIATYRDGTPIPQVTDDTEWSNLTTGAWCYYDNDPTKEKLYNWYAVMGIHDNDENTPNKEFAPEGWHVPSDTEWTTLEDYLIGNGYNYDGTTTGNKIAKAMASVTGWNNSTTEGAVGNNQNTNNSSGFNGLPIGYCNNNGLFGGKSIDAYFWSSSEFNSDTAWYSLLFNNNSNHIIDHYFSKKSGFSVRFVRN
ncbi:FISUMP domain-containing protein [uncultured Polaribacter sp.]|uniref:FISUMP domain-containing protein n=1 Tax=uncultured Polaribacter sp. TaxID=174711 RepID=UPI00261A8AB4|nr:FISUMP domain-containing protein [uncultured Polaribacter sp.]